jgi:hypothetical protein
MSRVLKEKERRALGEIVAMGQTAIPGFPPSRKERKAAKAAFRVLQDHKAVSGR